MMVMGPRPHMTHFSSMVMSSQELKALGSLLSAHVLKAAAACSPGHYHLILVVHSEFPWFHDYHEVGPPHSVPRKELAEDWVPVSSFQGRPLVFLDFVSFDLEKNSSSSSAWCC